MTANLQRFSNSDLEEFVHSSIDGMLGLSTSSNSMQPNLTNEEIELTKRTLSFVLCSVAMTENDSSLIKSLHEKLPNLEKSQIGSIRDAFQIRRIDIMKYMVKNLNSLNIPLLNNFNWRLKWVLGSSTLASYKDCLLQSDFVFKTFDDDEFKQITLELNMNELDYVINSLETANQKLCQL